jgi:anti-sigma regulatory factor (Ser/Thr protein kinase)
VNPANECILHLRTDLSEIARAVEVLDQLWTAHALDPDLQADLNIAAEEVLSNVMRHGAPPDSEVVLAVQVLPEQVRLEVQDAGAEFNPLLQKMLDPSSSLEERRAGGMGLFMVVNMMDRTSYQRRDGLNCFTLVRLRS